MQHKTANVAPTVSKKQGNGVWGMFSHASFQHLGSPVFCWTTHENSQNFDKYRLKSKEQIRKTEVFFIMSDFSSHLTKGLGYNSLCVYTVYSQLQPMTTIYTLTILWQKYLGFLSCTRQSLLPLFLFCVCLPSTSRLLLWLSPIKGCDIVFKPALNTWKVPRSWYTKQKSSKKT